MDSTFTKNTRRLVVNGRTIEVEMEREANGHNFKVWHKDCPNGGRLYLGEGWSAGTIYDAMNEAEQIAAAKLPRR